MTAVSAKEEDLTIPKFLRREPGEVRTTITDEKTATATAEFVEPWKMVLDKIEPLEFRQYLEEKIRQGRFERRWLVVREPYHTQLSVDETLKSFRAKWQEKKEKAEKNAATMRERVKHMREASPTHGLIPLRKILEEMGPDAKRRGHAKAAIDAAGIEHVKYHWSDSPVTLARVKQVIRDYVPPPKGRRGERPSFPEDAVIDFRGRNPKKEGTSAHTRWKLLMDHSGSTVGKFLEADGNPTTLKNAIAKGSVKLIGGIKKEEKIECKSRPSQTKNSTKQSRGSSRKKSARGPSRRGRT